MRDATGDPHARDAEPSRTRTYVLVVVVEIVVIAGLWLFSGHFQ